MAVYEWVQTSTLPAGADNYDFSGTYKSAPWKYVQAINHIILVDINGNNKVLHSDDDGDTWSIDDQPYHATDRPWSFTGWNDLNYYYDGFDHWFMLSDWNDRRVAYSYFGDPLLYVEPNASRSTSDTVRSCLTMYSASSKWGGEYTHFIAGYDNTPSAAWVVWRKYDATDAVVLNLGSTVPLALKGTDAVVAVFTNTNAYRTTTNGSSWTSRTLPVALDNTRPFVEVVDGDKFVVLREGDTTLYVSTDAVTWSTKTLPIAAGSWPLVAHDGSMKWLITFKNWSPFTSPTPYLYSEDDGATWEQVTPPSTLGSNGQAFPFYTGSAFKIVSGAAASPKYRVFQLANATPPETVWSNVIGCNVL